MPIASKQSIHAKLSTVMIYGFLVVSLAACSDGQFTHNDDSQNIDPPPDSQNDDPPPDSQDDDPPPDTKAPSVSASTDKDLGVRESVVFEFDEPMDPDSLALGGTLAALSDGGVWNDDYTRLTVSPGNGTWESGAHTLTVDVADTAGNAMETFDAPIEIRLVFENFQAASVVIGQADFAGRLANQGGGATPAANTLNSPYGFSTFAGDRLWIADFSNRRLLGFDGVPEANNASATWVVGQPDFVSNAGGSSATEFSGIQQGIEHDDRLYLLEYSNNRITVFDPVPLTPPATAAHVIGQPDLVTTTTACDAVSLDAPETMAIADGKLIVADSNNNRVLIWNTVPTDTNAAPADIVLGQGSMTHCVANDDNQDTTSGDVSARTMNTPSGVWSDGDRLVVADGYNNRVLIWNTFPESNFTPADVVLGQGDFSHITRNDDNQNGTADLDEVPTARTLYDPYEAVWSNGLQLFVGDSGNNRVLVWNNFPTENFQPADIVLGQSDFAHNMANDDDQDGSSETAPSAHTLSYPVGGGVHRDKLLVHDSSNNRVLVYESQ